MRNFVKLAGYYLGEENLICLFLGTWLHHIDRFELQYDKYFAKDPHFGADLMDHIHKCVHMFLYSCNTTTVEDA